VGALESDDGLGWVAGDDGRRQSDGAGPAKWRGFGRVTGGFGNGRCGVADRRGAVGTGRLGVGVH